MKKKLLALAMLSVPIMSVAQVQLVVTPKGDISPVAIPLDEIKQLNFLEDDTYFVLEHLDQRYRFSYDVVQSIKFQGLVDDIAATCVSDDAWRVSYNQGQLTVSGMCDAVTHADIFDLNGCRHMSLPRYSGQTIDVSSLPKGAYILRVGQKTFKFLK